MRITTQDRIKEVWMQVIDPKKIRKLMIVQEISQRQLAEVIGWKSHSYLGRILNGQIKSIDSDAAARIAVTLGVGMDDLFLPKASTVTVHSELSKKAS